MGGFVLIFSVFAAVRASFSFFMYMETRHAFSSATARCVYLAAVVFLSSSYPLCKILLKKFSSVDVLMLGNCRRYILGFENFTALFPRLMVYFVFYSFAFFTHNPVVSKKLWPTRFYCFRFSSASRVSPILSILKTRDISFKLQGRAFGWIQQIFTPQTFMSAAWSEKVS